MVTRSTFCNLRTKTPLLSETERAALPQRRHGEAECTRPPTELTTEQDVRLIPTDDTHYSEGA
eukprot:5520294-Pyramimonas_sp.AAC.1